MTRKKWNEEEKKKALDIAHDITEHTETFNELFDFFDGLTDNIEDLFQCNRDCTTCTCEERAICLQKFKEANFYWIKLNKELVYLTSEAIRKLVTNMNRYNETFELFLTEKIGEEKDAKNESPKKRKELEDDDYDLDYDPQIKKPTFSRSKIPNAKKEELESDSMFL